MNNVNVLLLSFFIQSVADSHIKIVHEWNISQSKVEIWKALQKYQKVATFINLSCSSYLDIQVFSCSHGLDMYLIHTSQFWPTKYSVQKAEKYSI